jgi:hypothetical protein
MHLCFMHLLALNWFKFNGIVRQGAPLYLVNVTLTSYLRTTTPGNELYRRRPEAVNIGPYAVNAGLCRLLPPMQAYPDGCCRLLAIGTGLVISSHMTIGLA